MYKAVRIFFPLQKYLSVEKNEENYSKLQVRILILYPTSAKKSIYPKYHIEYFSSKIYLKKKKQQQQQRKLF